MRRYAGLLTIILAVALAAPPARAQEKPRYGGELIFAVPSQPPSYDAHQEETFGVIHPVAPHYNTLLRVERDNLPADQNRVSRRRTRTRHQPAQQNDTETRHYRALTLSFHEPILCRYFRNTST